MAYARRQLLFGALFILAGLCVLYFGFPNQVVFYCDRGESVCTLTRIGFLRSEEIQIPLDVLTGAELETIGGRKGKSSVRLWITTRDGPIPFTAYSIGGIGSESKKRESVSAIQNYVSDPTARTLTVVQDERPFFYIVSTGLVGFGFLPLISGSIKLVRGDRD
jgi:hypothetical protein